MQKAETIIFLWLQKAETIIFLWLQKAETIIFLWLQKAETIKEEIASHWHPNITVNVVHDFTPWTPNMVPAPLSGYIEFTPALDRSV